MSGLSAKNFNLQNRGLIIPGYHADLVIFDPEKICDQATFEKPIALSAGIENVYVNGVETFNNGSLTGQRNGRYVGKQQGAARQELIAHLSLEH